MKKTNLNVEWKPIEQIVEYARNAKQHPIKQVEKIASSLATYGWRMPILIDKENVIVAGHGRFQAAKAIAHTEVPVLVVDDLDEHQIAAFRIADNKVAESEWDDEMLSFELGSLDLRGMDLELTGFEMDELKDLLPDDSETKKKLDAEQAEEDARADEIPGTIRDKITGVKRGDVWLLGNHRLMCGDSTSRDDVDKLMNGEKADMVFTDPPYGIGYEYNEHNDSDAEGNSKLVKDVFSLHDCGKVWTPGKMNLERDLGRFGKTKIAIWYKKFAQAGSGMGGASTFEPILIINPKEKKLANDVIVLGTEREFIGGTSLRELHSCPKPVGLYQHLIEAFSSSSDRIFEPFCGSGTTLIACEKTKRNCFGMEIDAHYCGVILRRWCEYTGQDATRESDGALWSETMKVEESDVLPETTENQEA